ncbi:MAG: hypothetical protein IKO47_13975, partial [Ruminococcus sp.]|nr:hypothetical protein [Ruminococcus sp.]
SIVVSPLFYFGVSRLFFDRCAVISGLGVSPTSIGGISLAVRRIPLCLLFLLRLGAYFLA